MQQACLARIFHEWPAATADMTVLPGWQPRLGTRHHRADEKLNIFSASSQFVIPEGAKRLSGIQKKGGYWISRRRRDFASSGMTIVYCLVQSKSKEKSSAMDN